MGVRVGCIVPCGVGVKVGAIGVVCEKGVFVVEAITVGVRVAFPEIEIMLGTMLIKAAIVVTSAPIMAVTMIVLFSLLFISIIQMTQRFFFRGKLAPNYGLCGRCPYN